MRISLTSLTTDASWACLADFAVVGLEFFEQLDLVRGSRSCDHGGDGFAADAEMGLDEAGDLARTGQHRLDVQAGQRLQFVEGVDVERIAGGHDQGAVLPVERQEAAAMDQLGRQGPQRFRSDGHLGQIDQVQAEIIGQGRQECLLLGPAAFQEQGVQRPGRRLSLGVANCRQIVCVQNALVDQNGEKIHARSTSMILQ